MSHYTLRHRELVRDTARMYLQLSLQGCSTTDLEARKARAMGRHVWEEAQGKPRGDGQREIL